jgi:hypothetical protein
LVEEGFVGFTKLIKGCSNRIIASSYVVVFDCVANFKAILDFIKDFSNLPAFMRLVAPFISEIFWKEFCFEKTGIKKRRDNKNKKDFNIE